MNKPACEQRSRSTRRARPWTSAVHVFQVATLFATTFGAALLVFLTQLILVRIVSVSEYGQLVALLAFINLMTPVSAYGVGWFWLRAFGEEGWTGLRWVPPSARLLTLTCITSTFALVIYTWLRFDPTERVPASILAVPVLLGQAFAETTSAKFQLEERFFLLAAWQALTQTGRFVVAVCLFELGPHVGIAPLAGYGMLGAALTLVGLLSLRDMIRGRISLRGHGNPPVRPPDRVERPSLLRIAGEATPFCLWTVFYSLYFQSVVILLSVFVGKPAAAVYNVAFQIISAAYLVPNIVYSKFLFGKIFRWAEHNTAKFYAAFHVGVIAMTVVGTAAMITVMVAAPALVPILFGRNYAGSVPVVMALSATIPVRFIQTAYASLYYSKDMMKRNVAFGGITAVASVSLNIMLLPLCGLTGAVVTQAIAEVLLLGLYIGGITRSDREMKLWHSYRLSTFLRAFKTLTAASTE